MLLSASVMMVLGTSRHTWLSYAILRIDAAMWMWCDGVCRVLVNILVKLFVMWVSGL